MGYTRHHAVIVTTHSALGAELAHAKARELFPYCGRVLVSPVNGWHTVLIPTDGSKEGWPESDAGDAARAAFKAWLDEQRYSDRSSPFRWIEVQYGDDEGENAILDSEEARR